VAELEEKNLFLQEKHKDNTSLESLRGRMLENQKI